MQVPQSLKNKVDAQISKSLLDAEQYYGITFDEPTISYTKGGTTAGTADLNANHINLNPVLLVENKELFISRTVVHELAHLLDGKLNPESHQSGGVIRTRRGFRRGKRSLHGPTWKAVMSVLGAESSRCHTYDVSSVKKTRTQKLYVWVSKEDSSVEMELGVKRHNKMKTGMVSYWPRGKSHHTFVFSHMSGLSPAPKIATSHNRPKPKAKSVPKKKATSGVSKIAVCRSIFSRMPQSSRKEIIRTFVSEAGATPAGASTYYQTIKKENK